MFCDGDFLAAGHAIQKRGQICLGVIRPDDVRQLSGGHIAPLLIQTSLRPVYSIDRIGSTLHLTILTNPAASSRLPPGCSVPAGSTRPSCPAARICTENRR